MKQGFFWRRWLKGDADAEIVGQPPGYSRYTDPEIFPAFGGDALDPPPYSTDRRSTVDTPKAATPGSSGGLASFAYAMNYAWEMFGANQSLPSRFPFFPARTP